MDTTVGLYFVGGGLLLAVLVFIVWRRGRSSPRGGSEDAFSVLGIDAKTALSRSAPTPVGRPPPVDLSKPITGEVAWKAVRAYAKDTAFQRATETVRLRYQLVGNQMLLPNSLREIMERSSVDFREAMIRMAEDDGIGGRR